MSSFAQIDAHKLTLWCAAVVKCVDEEREKEKNRIVNEIVQRHKKRRFINWLFRCSETNPVDVRTDLDNQQIDWDHPFWIVRATGGEAKKTAKRLLCAAQVAPYVSVSAEDLKMLSGWSPEGFVQETFGEKLYK